MTLYRRNLCLAAALFVTAAAVRLPIEQKIASDLRSKSLLPGRINHKLSEQVSQGMLLAILGGMRSAVASALELEAFSNFAARPPAWHKVDQFYALCTELQPKESHYWEFQSWMLASNCAEFYATEGGASRGLEQSMRQFYRQRGLEVAEKGIRHLPDNYRLYREAGKILSWPNRELNPNPDHAKAAELYLRGSQCPGAPRYIYRAYVYELAKVPGQEQESYRLLKKLYDRGGEDRQPSVITHLQRLEIKLEIPAAQRIDEPVKAP